MFQSRHNSLVLITISHSPFVVPFPAPFPIKQLMDVPGMNNNDDTHNLRALSVCPIK